MDVNEVKFRAWDGAAKEWRYFTFAKLLEPRATIWMNGYSDWGQCTGLKDKDTGVEIYDGDIVTAPWHWTEPHTFVFPTDFYSVGEMSLENELTIVGNARDNERGQRRRSSSGDASVTKPGRGEGETPLPDPALKKETKDAL